MVTSTRRVTNKELTDYVYDELQKSPEINDMIDYNCVSYMITDSIKYSDDLEKNEDGEILNLLAEEEIQKLKKDMLDGISVYLEEKLEREKEEEVPEIIELDDDLDL